MAKFLGAGLKPALPLKVWVCSSYLSGLLFSEILFFLAFKGISTNGCALLKKSFSGHITIDYDVFATYWILEMYLESDWP